jgi:acetyltransferase
MGRADAWDLRRRFMGSPPPTDRLLRQLAGADGVHDLAVGAFADKGRLVGVAQFDRQDDRPVAEFAIEIAHDWQQVGLGTALSRYLAALATQRGIREFTATFFSDNVPVQRLLHDLGGEMTGVDGSESSARVRLPG